MSPSESAGRKKILIVEDNTDTCILLEHLLSVRYEADIAENADIAIDKALKKRYDLLILDINLGHGPSGLEVERHLRTRPEYATAPILALTAYALPGDRERFLESGFTAYLGKPFNVDELLDTVRELTASE